MGEVVTIVQERLPWHPLLGRNIRTDSRSLAYPFTGQGLSLVSANHVRHVGPFDQGDTGSCTGNAAIGKMATDPYFQTRTPIDRYALTEQGARDCYSDATFLDSYPGAWPPDDTGSDGTAVAQALKVAGDISGYTHATTGVAARLALGRGPVIVGMKWYNSMFAVGPGGRMVVDPSSELAGGHEICFDMIDVDKGQCWFTQSWGPGFGVTRDAIPGRAYFTFDDFDRLIEDQGDCTIFTPRTEPSPTPQPIVVADDAALWAAGAHFSREHHIIPEYCRLADTLAAWGSGKGFQ